MYTYSREFLQTYRQNFQAILYCDGIQAKVLNAAFNGQNRYVEPFNSKKQPISNGQYVETDHMINMLKTRFPGCLVEYQEVKNINGKVESGIVIDWT